MNSNESNRPTSTGIILPLLDHLDREQGDINSTANRRKYWHNNLSAKAKDIFDRDKKFFLHQNLSTPVMQVLARAYGIYVEDVDGKKYIDMHGNGVHNAGFNNPRILAAMQRQMNAQMTFCPRRYTNEPTVNLAEKLAQISPGELTKSLFCPGGSEAIEMAVALAKQVTGNFKTISYWGSFHGATITAASVGGEALFKRGLGPLLPGACHVDFPNYYRNPWGFTSQEQVDRECLRQIQRVLECEPGIAALIAEPISASPVIPSNYYWQGVQALCRQYGVLIILMK